MLSREKVERILRERDMKKIVEREKKLIFFSVLSAFSPPSTAVNGCSSTCLGIKMNHSHGYPYSNLQGAFFCQIKNLPHASKV